MANPLIQTNLQKSLFYDPVESRQLLLGQEGSFAFHNWFPEAKYMHDTLHNSTSHIPVL
jgi:hypothetical protein